VLPHTVTESWLAFDAHDTPASILARVRGFVPFVEADCTEGHM
jgi:hypothetical protein